MSRFRTFVQRTLRSPRSSTPIHLDLGSLNTKIAVRGKLITSEPTCLACQTETGEVVMVGNEAAQLLGKTPPNIEVVWPIRDGKVVEIHSNLGGHRANINKKGPMFLHNTLRQGRNFWYKRHV